MRRCTRTDEVSTLRRYSAPMSLRPHRSGPMLDPSGWAGNCPFGGCRACGRALPLTVPVTPGGSHMSNPRNENDSTAAELVEETLVEEVSIDGMCGVY